MSADPNCTGCGGLGCDGGGQMACVQCGGQTFSRRRRAVTSRPVKRPDAPSSPVIERDECFVRSVSVRTVEHKPDESVRVADCNLAIMGFNNQARVTFFPVTDEEIKRLENAVRDNTPLRFILEPA